MSGIERTHEVLVRKCLHACPDGDAVSDTEHIEVVIEWPNGKPSQSRDYRMDGQWVLSNEASERSRTCTTT